MKTKAKVKKRNPDEEEENYPQSQIAPEPTDDDWIVLQEVLHAISELPTVWERIEAYLIARNIEAPQEAVERWRKIADA